MLLFLGHPTPKMSINAINALHHTLPNEDPIVEELISELGDVPRWGADNEFEDTHHAKYLQACRNLIGCFDHSLEFTDPRQQALCPGR